MVPRLRTIAILMLLAGLSLGVFTARALRAFSTTDLLQDRQTSGNARIEQLVTLYAEEFDLDALASSQVRDELTRYDQALNKLYWQLRQDHKDQFRALHEEASRRIEEVLEKAREGR